MPQLTNTYTGKPEKVRFTDLDSVIKAGTHKYGDNDLVKVKSPNGPDVFEVKGKNLQSVLNDGYSIETPLETAQREYLEDNSGIKGATKVAIGQAVNQLALGIPEIIYDHVADPWEVKKVEALKDQHQIANIAGGITGFAGSLALGGPLFKGAATAGELAERGLASKLAEYGVERGSKSIAKALTAKLVPAVAKLGTEGIVIAAPQALTEASLGDYEAAGESIAAGGLVGGIFGAVSGIGGDIIKTARKLVPYKSAEDFADVMAAKTLGFTKGQIKKQAKWAAKGEAYEDVKEIANITRNATFENPETGIVQKVWGKLETPEDLAGNIAVWNKQSGEKLGELRDFAEKSGYKTIYPRGIKEDIENALSKNYNLNSKAFLNSPAGQAYQTIALTLDEAGLSGISLREAAALKGNIKQFAKNADSTIKGIGKLAYGKLANAENEGMAKVLSNSIRDGKLSEASPIYDDFLKAKNNYWASESALRAIDDRVSSIRGNKMFGLTDNIFMGSVATVSALLSGGISAVPTLMSVAGGLALKKVAEKYGPSVGVTLGKDAIAKTNDAIGLISNKLNKIPEYLGGKMDKATKVYTNVGLPEKWVKGKATKATMSLGAMARMLPEEHQGKSKEEQLKIISDRLSQVTTNPVANSHVNDIATYMTNAGMPNVSNAFLEKVNAAASYLQGQLPKPLTPVNPLTPHNWKPSPAEISGFERKVQAVHDPLSILDDFKHNTLTKDKVDAVKTVYPKLYTAITNKVVDYVAGGNAKALDYGKRLKLGMLLGIPLDNSVQISQQLQMNWLKASSYQNMNAKDVTFSRAKNTMSEMQRLV